jgi:peptidoglycan-N-acetylglucosamine deacetylase
MENVRACSEYINTDLFRPPYGKLMPSQIRLLKKDFRIIMWDVLSKDYDPDKSGEECYRRVIRKTKDGSIIVFHDSLKAEVRLRYALPATLEYFSERGFTFSAIG